MKTDIRSKSTHLSRKTNQTKEMVEELLHLWGAYRAERIFGLGLNGASPIAIAIERHKAVALAWSKGQPKQTRVVRPAVPSYNGNRLMSAVNKAVVGLSPRTIFMLVKYYEERWRCNRFCFELGWQPRTFYNNLYSAREEFRKHPEIIKLLRIR